jgi:hypothetical protein
MRLPLALTLQHDLSKTVGQIHCELTFFRFYLG